MYPEMHIFFCFEQSFACVDGCSDPYFWGHHKIGLYLGVISMHFRILSYGQGTDWGIYFGVGKISNIFWGA